MPQKNKDREIQFIELPATQQVTRSERTCKWPEMSRCPRTEHFEYSDTHEEILLQDGNLKIS